MKVYQVGPACIVLLMCCLCIASCGDDRVYQEEIAQWRMERHTRLQQARGWLSLAGLFPLQAGVNSFGYGDSVDIRLPGTGSGMLALIGVDSSGILFEAIDTSIRTEDGDGLPTGHIDPNGAPLMHLGALYWTFLERSGNMYLRLWDTLSPARTSLHEIPHFPVNPDWQVNATFTKADSGTTILLDDVLGLKRPYPVMGALDGVWGNTPFSIIALDGGSDELFLIFEDATTDVETYPAGRYLYVPYPGVDGNAIIDFNKAYNPPCAFTEFATCLLAPPENRLPFAVRAGEKTYGKHQ